MRSSCFKSSNSLRRPIPEVERVQFFLKMLENQNLMPVLSQPVVCDGTYFDLFTLFGKAALDDMRSTDPVSFSW